jgi:hypothetical protein
MSKDPNYNSRYLAYCKSNNNTPDQQKQIDLVDWPGGKMTGFILWMKEQWYKFYAEHNLDPTGIYSGVQQR